MAPRSQQSDNLPLKPKETQVLLRETRVTLRHCFYGRPQLQSSFIWAEPLVRNLRRTTVQAMLVTLTGHGILRFLSWRRVSLGMFHASKTIRRKRYFMQISFLSLPVPVSPWCPLGEIMKEAGGGTSQRTMPKEYWDTEWWSAVLHQMSSPRTQVASKSSFFSGKPESWMRRCVCYPPPGPASSSSQTRHHIWKFSLLREIPECALCKRLVALFSPVVNPVGNQSHMFVCEGTGPPTESPWNHLQQQQWRDQLWGPHAKLHCQPQNASCRVL